MSNVRVFANVDTMAATAAEKTVQQLQKAIKKYGSASWVLAGGSTPLAAYHAIANKHAKSLDWSKVTLIMGDERIGPMDGPDNNWHAVQQIIGSLPTKNLVPQSELSAEDAAKEYEVQLKVLPLSDSGFPRLDVVWLGVGQDGHTLSLFPSHASLLPSGGLVTAVRDSPKPPAGRISLTLRALQGAAHVIVLATGADKKHVVSDAIAGSYTPIGIATGIVTTHEGTVTWLVDKAAAPTD